MTRKRKRQQYCLLSGERPKKVLLRGSCSEMRRKGLEVRAVKEWEEALAAEVEQRARIQEQQNRDYEAAALVDRQAAEQRERKERLRQFPEERALLYDTLFLQAGGSYVPCLERVKVP
jgi:hypothetical protein